MIRSDQVMDCTAEMDDSGESRRAGGSRDLEAPLLSFFPFDPYQLPVSERRLSPVGYLKLRDCIGEEYDDDDDASHALLSSADDATPTDSSLGSSLQASFVGARSVEDMLMSPV